MILTHISLRNFRNIAETAFVPHPSVNIIYGDNAQGKTNLMEALWLFTGARSFRGARENELIAFQQEEASVALQFEDGRREQTAQILLSRNGRRQAQLNHVPLSSPAQLAGQFFAVVFSPAHLSLVKDGPEVRRRFLDQSICQLLPRYSGLLTDLQRVLKQRNALLRDLRLNSGLMELLEVFDLSLAKLSAQILRARRRYIQRLAGYAAQAYEGISQGRAGETLSLAYESGFGPQPPPDSLDLTAVAQALLEQLRAGRQADVQSGTTCQGPHHDDLQLTLGGLSARSYGSQGQQRSCVLALKLAESRLLEEISGQPPIILLDDVMSELDASRRDYLLNHLQGRQVFITCCEKAYFTGLSQGRCFYMREGQLREEPLSSPIPSPPLPEPDGPAVAVEAEGLQALCIPSAGHMLPEI